ncbi:DUF4157 domain-containing protein [Sphingosinicella sp. CPCC 101087]|uniref:eCIS core domain-containing protein n=1 Tax=Sphingosinicella sp. CPCC 101087 TaxID=2497754 RepID=UPI00101CE8E5|nr:DUF4157 domain-containing protein [Sphingosinicella sp. CPCC 101087]
MSGTRAFAEPGRTTVGRHGAQAEHAADARARTAERKLGLSSRPAVSHDPSDSDFAAPPAVDQVARTPGQPLPASQRRIMETAFGHDFGRVRIHSDQSAKVAAAGIGARAFTVGSHIALPGGETGALTHELAHVVAKERGEDEPRTVRRLGVGEWFARLVGEGTYSDDELKVYLLEVEKSKEPVGGSEGDDMARQVVAKKMHQSRSKEVRLALIREMISGFTGNDDEQAILAILKDATLPEREWLVDQLGGPKKLREDFHGDEEDELLKLLGSVADHMHDEVPLDWRFEYDVKGGSKLPDLKGPLGIFLNNLSIKPSGADEPLTLASNESMGQQGAKEVLLRRAMKHPRGKDGSGRADFMVGRIDSSGDVAPDTRVPEPVSAPYPAISPFNHTVVVKLSATVEGMEQDQIANMTEHSEEQIRTREESLERKEYHERTDSEIRSEEETEVVREGEKAGETKGREVGKEQQKGTTREDVKKQEKTDETSKRDATDTKNETSKQTGTETTVTLTNEISGKLDGNFKAELATELGIGIGDLVGLALPIGRLSKGLFGKLKGLVKRGLKYLPFLDDDDASGLNLKIEANGTFSIGGTLKGEIARKWIDLTTTTTGTVVTDETGERHSRTEGSEERTGSSDVKIDRSSQQEGSSKERSKEKEAGRKTGKQVGREDRRGKEEVKGEKTGISNAEADKSGTTITKKRLVPVISGATLAFEVRGS